MNAKFIQLCQELEQLNNSIQIIESEMRAEYTMLRNIRKYRNMSKTESETQERLIALNKNLIVLEYSVINRCKEQHQIMTEKLKNNDLFLTEFNLTVDFNFCGPFMEDAPDVCLDYGFSNEMVTQLYGIQGIEIALDKSLLQNWIPVNEFGVKNECWLFYMLCTHCNLNNNALLSINCLWADIKVKIINRTEYSNQKWAKLTKSISNETI